MMYFQITKDGVQGIAQCDECDRVFNMNDEQDAEEYYYGHDCESLWFCKAFVNICDLKY